MNQHDSIILTCAIQSLLVHTYQCLSRKKEEKNQTSELTLPYLRTRNGRALVVGFFPRWSKVTDGGRSIHKWVLHNVSLEASTKSHETKELVELTTFPDEYYEHSHNINTPNTSHQQISAKTHSHFSGYR